MTGLLYLKKKLAIKYFKFILILIALQISSNMMFMYKSHPVQNVYFNFFSKPFVANNLPIDYWGLGNKKTIDFLLSNKKKFTISNSSFIPLDNLKYSKNVNYSYSNNINYNGTTKELKQSSDYIFTNYFYNRNPKNLEKYQIPKNYKSYFKLIIDNIVVNEVYTK